MQINTDMLITWGAKLQKYNKNDMVFYEGDLPLYYHQVASGRVKMFNVYEEGKEFTQGVFEKGCSFGEPVLFLNRPYPAHAIACVETVIVKIRQDRFLNMLVTYPNLYKDFLILFADRLYRKSITAREVVNASPELRLIGFLSSYKHDFPEKTGRILIPYTRQEIANFTGLRVETVIRTLTKMAREGKVAIVQHKLYF